MLLGYLLWRRAHRPLGRGLFLVVMYALYITFRALFFAVD